MLPANLYSVIEIQRERCHTLLKEAQVAQLLGQVQHNQPTLWASGLAQLGEWLIVCGCWLKRYNQTDRVTQLGSR